jgi:hypothetical protein
MASALRGSEKPQTFPTRCSNESLLKDDPLQSRSPALYAAADQPANQRRESIG